MTLEYLSLQPVDVLYLRGNRLFGEAGEHAEAQMPPWPSLFAGAIRSRILVDHGVPPEKFADGIVRDEKVKQVLGTPERPGTFRIGFVSLCRNAASAPEPVFPFPADLVAVKPEGDPGISLHILEPVSLEALPSISMCSHLPYVAVLRSSAAGKPLQNRWIAKDAFVAYLHGQAPDAKCVLPQENLWGTDARLGIALDNARRTAAQGRIYTTDAVALKPDAGFLLGIAGSDGLLPRDGLVRLGGDGRGASLAKAEIEEPWKFVPHTGRFRMILITPGIFPHGWLPPGIVREGKDFVLSFKELKARLICAAIPRQQVVSGWDLARQQPKPALRVVPAGSVYWFEKTAGKAEALQEILEEGLWPLFGNNFQHDAALDIDPQRRAEGFNNVLLGECR